ncbi:hypothetical protein K450DRAFT_252609 [Umbelopsis ramanniana AG]|uniref:Uncharacterized protein n=1 Tax=Umbelopsis ramanniana AG TaxID=1314678 RepID=A0AAD5HAU7_UMBRA|nr:uncharacterized protein K450DRAFT_252609 [Umbelopsis ramanniana AG]KAI8577322.1 hypothetical protein K450DRAFT_252609 [Umbelopsis ramanniana AG]
MDLPTWQKNAIDIRLNREQDENLGDLSIAKTDTVKNEPTIGFGQAMYTLLEANNQTWRTTFMHLRQGVELKGYFESAIVAIDQHIANDSSAHQDLLDSLVDKVLMTKNHHHNSACNIAQYLILYSESKSAFCDMLQQQLMSDNLRTKLAILRMIAYITEDWKNTADTQLANVQYTQAEVGTVKQFVSSCVLIASSSPISTQLSVLASDLVLVISRYILNFMARPPSEPSPVSGGKIQIIEIQQSGSQEYKDTAELLEKMTTLLQTMEKWLDVSEFLINLAWREIQLFLKVARNHLVSGDVNAQLLDKLSKFWDVISRALSSKYIRSKPKLMIKTLKSPNDLKPEEKPVWLLSTVCTTLIINGNRYRLFVPNNETDVESTQKLDTELLDHSAQLVQDYLDVFDVLPGFDKVGHNLRMALHCLRGDNIESDDLIPYQLEMLQLYPEDMNQYINYRFPNKLIEGIFQQLDKTSLEYNVCSKVLEGATPNSDYPTLIKHICTYIGHTDSQINQLAQDCIAMVLQREENCEESLFIFIECMRNVANGHVEIRQVANQQLSPANLLSGGGLPNNTNAAGGAVEKLNQMMLVVKEWAEKATKNSWERVIPMLTTKTYACRKDQTYTTVWKTISAAISADPDLVRIVTSCCVDIMEQQPRLTEEMINDPTDEGALAVQDLTFARLCPLLILLSLPETAFSSIVADVDVQEAGDYWMEASTEQQPLDTDKSLSMRLLQALLIRAEHIMEIQYIRPVALTVLAGLFGSQGRFLKLCTIKLQKLLDQWRDYHVVIKYWIYSFCVWAKGPWTRTLSNDDAFLLSQLKDTCLDTISHWHDIPGNDEFQKLKMGAAEATALADGILVSLR